MDNEADRYKSELRDKIRDAVQQDLLLVQPTWKKEEHKEQ